MIILIPLFSSCEETDVISDTVEVDIISLGILEIEFEVPLEGLLKPGCVKRYRLDLAYNSDDLYRENFFHSFNVSDVQDTYTLRLAPGSYHFQAGIVCICETNSCSAAQFPGGQFGLRFTADMFEIKENETTHILPAFH
ncbi:hypothetical protein ACFLSY_01310 [Bacteroidota bacterium]